MRTPLGSYTFTLRRNADGSPIYQVRLFTGQIVAAEWPDEGSAYAGALTEERRQQRKVTTSATSTSNIAR